MSQTESTTIQLSKDAHTALFRRKDVPGDTYEDVIAELLVETDGITIEDVRQERQVGVTQ